MILEYFRDTPVPLIHFFETIKNPKPGLENFKNQTRARQNQANVAREEI